MEVYVNLDKLVKDVKGFFDDGKSKGFKKVSTTVDFPTGKNGGGAITVYIVKDYEERVLNVQQTRESTEANEFAERVLEELSESSFYI